MTKKGKALEQLVGKIQEVLKDKYDTSVKVGVHLKDKEGISREFDVLVRVTNQGLPSIIVFECKDYSTSSKQTKVDIKIIDGLIGKCANIPEIHQKVIVSTTGFTDNAKIKAVANGITLCSLDKIPMEEILSKHKVYFPMPRYIVNKDAVYSITHPDNVNISEEIGTPILYFEKNDNIFNIELEVLKQLCHFETRGKLAKMFLERGREPFICIATILFSDKVYINGKSGRRYPVQDVKVPVKIDFELDEGEPVKQQKYTQGKDILVTEYQFNNSPQPFGTVIIDDGEKCEFLFNINNKLETPHIQLKK